MGERIAKLFAASGWTYGSPRIHQDLVEEGWAVSVNTVAQLMAELGPSGRKAAQAAQLYQARQAAGGP